MHKKGSFEGSWEGSQGGLRKGPRVVPGWVIVVSFKVVLKGEFYGGGLRISLRGCLRRF